MHGRVKNFSKAYLTQILMFPERLSRVLLQRLLNMIRWIEASALILLTILAPCISESCIQIKLSHFFVVPQKVLWRPFRPS